MLTGPEKAVLFLLSLDEEVARPIVHELGEAELRKLRAVASSMHEVPAGAIDEAYKEFIRRSAAAVAVPRGGLPYLRRLSAGAFGESRARQMFEDGVTSPFAKLEMTPPDAVAALLSKEPPQVIGAILSRLEPKAAAAILTGIPEDRQPDVLAHVGRMTQVPASVLEEMASALAAELPASDEGTTVNVDGISKAAQILNAAGKDAAATMLLNLEIKEQQLAAEVRQAMFTFEDLRALDPKAMRELLREVPGDKLAIALKGSSDEVRTTIFTGLSSRAAELLRDDLEMLGAVRRSEIERARTEIVQIALRLEGEGRIDLGRAEEGA